MRWNLQRTSLEERAVTSLLLMVQTVLKRGKGVTARIAKKMVKEDNVPSPARLKAEDALQSLYDDLIEGQENQSIADLASNVFKSLREHYSNEIAQMPKLGKALDGASDFFDSLKDRAKSGSTKISQVMAKVPGRKKK